VADIPNRWGGSTQVNSIPFPGLLPIVPWAPRGGSQTMKSIHHHVYSFPPEYIRSCRYTRAKPRHPLCFDKVGAVKIGCNIHDWLSGIISCCPRLLWRYRLRPLPFSRIC